MCLVIEVLLCVVTVVRKFPYVINEFYGLCCLRRSLNPVRLYVLSLCVTCLSAPPDGGYTTQFMNKE